jgi:hypothetical protein
LCIPMYSISRMHVHIFAVSLELACRPPSSDPEAAFNPHSMPFSDSVRGDAPFESGRDSFLRNTHPQTASQSANRLRIANHTSGVGRREVNFDQRPRTYVENHGTNSWELFRPGHTVRDLHEGVAAEHSY